MPEWLRSLEPRYAIVGPAKVGSRPAWLVEAGGMRYLAEPLPRALAERDALLLRGLAHAGLPRVVEVTPRALVMAPLEGETLGERVAAGRWRSDEPRTLGLMAHTADVLRYLHGLRPPVVHRDVRPDNLLLSANGTLVLLGIEHATDHPRGLALGTPGFAGAPGYTPFEQFEGRAVPASDIHALGATFLHLLTGAHPLEAPRSGVGLDFAALGLGQRTAELLAACLALDPSSRPTAEDVISLATEALQPPPPRTFPPRPAESIPPLPAQASLPPEPVQDSLPPSPSQPSLPAAVEAAKPRGQSMRPVKGAGLEQMWSEVLADPTDQARHARFITFAVEAGMYQQAAQKYSELERDRPELAEAAAKHKRDIGTRAAAKIVVSLPREDHRKSLVATGAWIALGVGGLLVIVAAVLRMLGLLAMAVPMVLLGVSLYSRSRSEPPPRRRGQA